MDMSTVKNITIPEGSVTKITDPNGILGTQRMIWGDADVYPYRRLQYVTANGSSAINTGIRAGLNGTGSYYYTFTTKVMPTNKPTGASEQHIISSGDSASSHTAANKANVYPVFLSGDTAYGNLKTHFFANGQGYFYASSHGIENTTDISNNTAYTVVSNTIPTFMYLKVGSNLQNTSNGTQNNGYSNYNYGLGAKFDYYNRNNSNNGFSNGFYGRIYGMYATGRTENGNQQTRWFVPCQRKSDGAVGFVLITRSLDGTVSFNSFKTSEYTQDFLSGPVQNEYFDHTVAPSMGF